MIDFSSSGYLDVSVPPVPLPAPMYSGRGCMRLRMRVLPFGHPRIEGRVRLPGDYRGLPRPSSAPCAKASAVRPCHLPAPCAGHGIQRYVNMNSIGVDDIDSIGVAYLIAQMLPENDSVR